MAELDLAALGVYNHDEAKANAFARVLLIGPAKAGKTTCVAKTAPKPLIINCDGDTATTGASNQGAQFQAIDVDGVASWRRAIQTAGKMVEAEVTRTIMVDTVSLLAKALERALKQRYEGWDVWRHLENELVTGFLALRELNAHLFMIAHMDPREDTAAGILPFIGGQSKVWLPGVIDDWIMLEVDPDRNPPRQFLLGPQKKWTHSGRSVRKVTAIDADVMLLFKELGIHP